MSLRLTLAALVAALALAACGVKGEPVRPGAEETPETETGTGTGTETENES